MSNDRIVSLKSQAPVQNILPPANEKSQVFTKVIHTSMPWENALVLAVHRIVIFPLKLVWGIFNPSEFMPPAQEASNAERIQRSLNENLKLHAEACQAVEDWEARRTVLKNRIARLRAELAETLQHQE